MILARFSYKWCVYVGVFMLVACQQSAQDNGTDDTNKLEVTNKQEQTKKSNIQTKKTPRTTQLGTHLFLGTGSVQGVYFPIGGVICRLLNRHQSLHRLRCSLESTGGSVFNLRALKSGKFDLVFSQSDWQYHALKGTSAFAKQGANPELRAVFALESDALALMARKESNIKTLDDIQNRKVSFGYSRSLQYRIMSDLLQQKKWKLSKMNQVRMSDAKQIRSICNGDVDAILLMASSLNHHLANIGDCQLRFISIESKYVDALITEKPYYRKGTIFASDFFPGQEKVTSFGLGATFVANASTSTKAIYHVVKEIVENFKDFRSLHPSLREIKKTDLPYAGITAPLHPGAIRYYKEARLLKNN